MRWMQEKTRLKIIQLKIRALGRYNRLFFSIPGEVTQKGASGASTAAENVRRLAEEAVDRFDWKYAPRAKIAIRMHFSTQNKQPPELQNLVKFYLDPLKSVIFADDRQVSYLEAHYWRRSTDDTLSLEPSARIDVERSTDYNQRIKL